MFFPVNVINVKSVSRNIYHTLAHTFSQHLFKRLPKKCASLPFFNKMSTFLIKFFVVVLIKISIQTDNKLTLPFSYLFHLYQNTNNISLSNFLPLFHNQGCSMCDFIKDMIFRDIYIQIS